MTLDLIIASAGAGKSTHIVKKALFLANSGEMVLILTYTRNNQKELIRKICHINKYTPSNIIVKGWFAFLLEDMIRPYQRCIFPERIPGIFFNSSDPHMKNGRMIRGRSEKQNGDYNELYYLTKAKRRAHTTYLSKLAVRIISESKTKSTKRLSNIFYAIFVDEAQDLVGWDFKILAALAKEKAYSLTCVGDFRQTIYTTSVARKSPRSNSEKVSEFQRIGFNVSHMNISWRCVQSICDFASLLHMNSNIYNRTISKLDGNSSGIQSHIGLFAVASNDVTEYINRYNPMILRVNRKTRNDICNGHKVLNFGEAKGLGFDRVLIVPTQKQIQFLTGKADAFDADKTEKARNSFYVAVTRAKYSVTFLIDVDSLIKQIKVWRS